MNFVKGVFKIMTYPQLFGNIFLKKYKVVLWINQRAKTRLTFNSF